MGDKNRPRKNTIAIVGAVLGDEGKGRLVDNHIETFLKTPKIKKVYVIRFQGGSNAGHTIEKEGLRLALHQVPSCVLYENAYGIMDRGMFIHVEDLATEITSLEEKVGSLKGRLFLSDEAILCTDLERAEEVLNREKSGKAKGGTSRGVAPSYAHNLDRLGLKIFDLLDTHWKETLSNYYDQYQKEFSGFGKDIKAIEVPDFAKIQQTKSEQKRTVGSKKVFLERLKNARDWLLQRNLATNTFLIHQQIYNDSSVAVLFEGGQAAGLDAWTGTRPDITATNTTVYGVREGTAFWRIDDIEKRIGVFKVTYSSSVGARKMPTHIENEWAQFVRETAHEYGTTTGRPRDINYLDLAFLSYNVYIAGIQALEATHLDIAREDTPIKVCTHYQDISGNRIPYQPGLRYQEQVIPQYIQLPSWDGNECKKAKKPSELPKNALHYLKFIEKSVGLPIIAVTTGSKRENIIRLNGY